MLVRLFWLLYTRNYKGDGTMRKLLARLILGDPKSTDPIVENRSIAELRARVESMERKYEKLDLDWTEMYDKFRRLYARIAKRAIDDAAEAPEGRQGSPGVQGPPTINPAALRLLGRR